MTFIQPIADVLSTEYRQGFEISAHAHSAHQIVHAVSGVMRVSTWDGFWVVPPQRAIWMPAHQTHWIDCATDVSMRTVYLAAQVAGVPKTCEVWSVSPLMREVMVRLNTRPDPAMQAALADLLLLEIERIDATPLHLPEPRDPRARRVSDALLRDPADGRSLDDWARAAGATRRTLIRLFARETGMTFREWRRQLRVLRALEQLATGASVTATALDHGYATPSAFIQAFREVLGTTPARYFDD